MRFPLAFFFFVLAGLRGDSGGSWREVAPGLEVARLSSARGGPDITVVRVDPHRYRFTVLSARLEGVSPVPTVQEWASRYRLTGVINASMFQEDQLTSVGYLKSRDRVGPGAWSRDQAVFVSEPRRSGLPPVQLLDRSCQPASRLAGSYRMAVQSIRMLDCRGRNLWTRQPPQGGIACVGLDRSGRVLLVHVRDNYNVYDLIEDLKALPLQVARLMYVEGGRQAALHVVVGGRTVVSESGSGGAGLLRAFMADSRLPNVIGFAPR